MPGAGAGKASASGASFLSIFPHLELCFERSRITLSTDLCFVLGELWNNTLSLQRKQMNRTDDDQR